MGMHAGDLPTSPVPAGGKLTFDLIDPTSPQGGREQPAGRGAPP